MKSLLKNVATAKRRAHFLLALGVVLLLSLPALASAQESLGFHLPDSLRVGRDPFFFPSLSFTPLQLNGNQLSLGDQAIIGNADLLNSYNATWKRSFLIGASVYKPNIMQSSYWMTGKVTFFQRIQMVLGVAELVGVAYLGYKAIKNEPITKKKK